MHTKDSQQAAQHDAQPDTEPNAQPAAKRAPKRATQRATAKKAAKRATPPAASQAGQLPAQRPALPAPLPAVGAVQAVPLLSSASREPGSEVSVSESSVRVPLPEVRVPRSRGARAMLGSARAPSGFGRESERVSEIRPSENTGPQGSQAGARVLDHFSMPQSELVLPAADSSIETRVSNVTTSKFSKKNADCLMNSTEKSVQFSN